MCEVQRRARAPLSGAAGAGYVAAVEMSEKTGEDQPGLRPLKALTLRERVIDPETIPWVPYTDSIWVKPLRLNRKTGQWANLTKVVGGGQVNRHYHVNGVVGYVLEGSWYYAERDWVAKPGMMIWEPPGEVHTLISGDEGTLTLFHRRSRARRRRRCRTLRGLRAPSGDRA